MPYQFQATGNTLSVQLRHATNPPITMFGASGKPIVPLPTLVAGEFFRFTANAGEFPATIYVPYIDVPLAAQADNPVVFTSRHELSSAAPTTIMGPLTAGRVTKAWVNKTEPSQGGSGAALGTMYGCSGLYLVNGDTVGHDITLVAAGPAPGQVVTVRSGVIGADNFDAPAFGQSGINYLNSLVITTATATAVRNPVAFAVWTEQALAS
jgi:hypothetical protein